MTIRVGTLCFVCGCIVRPQCNGRPVEVVEPLQPMPWADGIHMSYGAYAPWIKEVFDSDTPKAAKPEQLGSALDIVPPVAWESLLCHWLRRAGALAVSWCLIGTPSGGTCRPASGSRDRRLV